MWRTDQTEETGAVRTRAATTQETQHRLAPGRHDTTRTLTGHQDTRTPVHPDTCTPGTWRTGHSALTRRLRVIWRRSLGVQWWREGQLAGWYGAGRGRWKTVCPRVANQPSGRDLTWPTHDLASGQTTCSQNQKTTSAQPDAYTQQSTRCN